MFTENQALSSRFPAFSCVNVPFSNSGTTLHPIGNIGGRLVYPKKGGRIIVINVDRSISGWISPENSGFQRGTPSENPHQTPSGKPSR